MRDPSERKRQAEEDLRRAEKRLAGNKVFEIIVSSHDMNLRNAGGGNLGDFISGQAAAIGACRDCKGVRVEESVDLNRDAKRFRFSCARTRVAHSLTCDDGVKVFINGKKEIESILLDMKKPTREVVMSFGDEYLTHPEIRGKTADYMIMDEVSHFDERDFIRMKEAEYRASLMTGYTETMPGFKHKAAPVVSKDTPKTSTEGDAW